MGQFTLLFAELSYAPLLYNAAKAFDCYEVNTTYICIYIWLYVGVCMRVSWFCLPEPKMCAPSLPPPQPHSLTHHHKHQTHPTNTHTDDPGEVPGVGHGHEMPRRRPLLPALHVGGRLRPRRRRLPPGAAVRRGALLPICVMCYVQCVPCHLMSDEIYEGASTHPFIHPHPSTHPHPNTPQKTPQNHKTPQKQQQLHPRDHRSAGSHHPPQHARAVQGHVRVLHRESDVL